MRTAFPHGIPSTHRTNVDLFIISLGLVILAPSLLHAFDLLFVPFGVGPAAFDLFSVNPIEYFQVLLVSNLLLSAGTGIFFPSAEQEVFVSGNLYEEREHFVQKLTNAIPDIVYVYDLDEGQLVYLNDRVSTILGYEPAELMHLGRGLLETFLHPDDQATAPRWFAKVSALQKGEILVHRFRVRHNNGEWRWLECREVVFKRDP